MNYKMIVQYDGSRYSGWQRQGNTSATIQYRLEQTLSELLDETVQINGSGRTDAGVHAIGQTVSFRSDKITSVQTVLQQLNDMLPEDIAVLSLEEAEPRFHARLSAKGKIYRYTVNNSHIPNVFSRRFEYRNPTPLDLAAMRTAADLLQGTHDYKGFSTGHTKKSTIRTISSIELQQQGEKLLITYTGDGFLYNMVRILTGTLLEVGWGTRSPESIQKVFSSCDRQQAGFTAPAQGLCLLKVLY